MKWGFLLALVGALTLAWGLWGSSAMALEREAAACAEVSANSDEQLSCWYRLVEREMQENGIEAALALFAHLYETQHLFASTGCHRHAHRMGDMAYYGIYLADPSLEKMEFPQETTGCGYGFFHGFLEHLTQDNPSARFVEETCEYLRGRLGSDMADIGRICYHGSGHGFTLSRMEQIPQSEWGNLAAFTTEPVAECEKLSKASEVEVEECRQGVFNVIVDWAGGGEYGFKLDINNPITLCKGVPQNALNACYYEMAQRTDRVAMTGIAKAWKMAQGAGEEYADMVFDVSVAGAVQQVIADDGQFRLAEECVRFPEKAEGCISSVVHGVFEHGPPQEEYALALKLCAHPPIADSAYAERCYKSVANRLARFYSPSQVQETICPAFPAEHRHLCGRTR